MADGTGSDQPLANNEHPAVNAELSVEARSNINALVAKVDATIASPSSRALKVWNALNKEQLAIWDLMCFTVEAQGMMAQLFPDFIPSIKRLNLDVYSTHYFKAANIAQWEQALPEELPSNG